MLLLCVSSTASCRSLLSQPRWIAVLLGLLRLGPPYAQRRALRLLRRLLPHCDPETLADSDDGAHAADGADWSIVSIVKESGAGAASSALSGAEDAVGSKGGDGCSQGDEVAAKGVAEAAGVGRMPRRSMGGVGSGGAPPVVRVTSLSNSVHTDIIPARSLLCFFLDAIGGSYQAAPRPDWLGDAEADGSAAGGACDGGGGSVSDRGDEGTLRELRSWYRGQAPSSSAREQGRSAWAFSQREGPLVCESVSLLRTLLQTSSWGGVTATLLQEALQRGNSCLRLLAREAADKAEAAESAAIAAAAASTAPAPTGPTAESANVVTAGSTAERSTDSGSGVAGTSSPLSSAEAAGEVSAAATIASPSLPAPAGEEAGRATQTGASTGASTTSTLLRTLGALSVLGGHVNVLYPGSSAEIMPIDYGATSRGGGGGRGRGSQGGSSGWGLRMGRSVFGLSGLERAASTAGGGGDGRGGGGTGIASASSASGDGATGGGRPCVVVSLSLPEGQAEVVLEADGHGGGSGGGGNGRGAGCTSGDARKRRVVPLDCLQAVPNVPLQPGILPPGLAQRVLETLTMWCLDKSLNAAFSERLSPTVVPLAPPAVGPSTPPRSEGSHGEDSGLATALSTTVLDRHLLLGLVRCQAAKAAQLLLLHPQTASDFVKSASASTPASGRKAMGGAGAVLLEVASGVSSSAGLGDVGAMEELVAMLLSHWQFSVLDGRAKKVQEARWGDRGCGSRADRGDLDRLGGKVVCCFLCFVT